MNSKIIIGNSVSYLQNIPHFVFQKIRKDVSFYDMQKYFRSKNWDYARTSLIESDGSFSTGLAKRVFISCQTHGVPVNIIDPRIIPDLGYLKLSQLISEPVAYDDQILATKSLLNSPAGRGIIVLPTGVGKTRSMKDTIQQLGVNTLVVVPSLTLKLQIYLYLCACFGEDNVGIFDKLGNNKPVSIANLDALENCSPEMFSFFDCVYFDEWHHEACETARMIDKKLFGDIYYKFAQTATNFRNSKNEQILLDCIMANQTYSLSVVDAIKKGYILPIQPIFHNIGDIPVPKEYQHGDVPWGEPEDNDPWDEYKKGLDYTKDIYPNWIVHHDERNEKLGKSAILMSHKQKIPTLVLVKNIEHGHIFNDIIPGSTFIHGELGQKHNFETVEAFNRGEIPNLIGTSVIGEGIDTKEAGAIVLGSGEKSKTRVMQNTGRVVRKPQRFHQEVGFVVDAFDDGHKTTKKHSNARKRIYQKEFGVKISKV